MKCKICSSETKVITNKLVLNKYKVDYHQCQQCFFVQTDEVTWLSEAYESAITSLDIGLISRNLYLQSTIPNIIDSFFSDAELMLDYGGGYGIFVRMMRDLGYNFYRFDTYCQNLFVKHFDLEDTKVKKFDVLTTFEVFEHLDNPLQEIEKMLGFSENIIFSTQLLPANIAEFDNWWYIAPQTGQHIAFYSFKSLEYIADKYNLNFYSNKNNLHVFSKNKIDENIVKLVFEPKKQGLLDRINRKFSAPVPKIAKKSLLQQDFEFVVKLADMKH